MFNQPRLLVYAIVIVFISINGGPIWWEKIPSPPNTHGQLCRKAIFWYNWLLKFYIIRFFLNFLIKLCFMLVLKGMLRGANGVRMSHPNFGQVWGWSLTLGKVGDLESSETPECSELNSKGQNTSHWGVLSVIGKVLKRKYRKWPRIDNSDICSPSYGQKKGRESNWQFDSRPLKVGNRPLPNVLFDRATWRWKDLDEGYNFGLDLVAIQLRSRELWRFKVSGISPGQFRDSISGVPGICAIRM